MPRHRHSGGRPGGAGLGGDLLRRPGAAAADRRQQGQYRPHADRLRHGQHPQGAAGDAQRRDSADAERGRHGQHPNGQLDISHVVRDTTPWPQRGQAKRAGINAFGFGGVNGHMVLREHRADTPVTAWPQLPAEQQSLAIIGVGVALADTETPDALLRTVAEAAATSARCRAPAGWAWSSASMYWARAATARRRPAPISSSSTSTASASSCRPRWWAAICCRICS